MQLNATLTGFDREVEDVPIKAKLTGFDGKEGDVCVTGCIHQFGVLPFKHIARVAEVDVAVA